MKCNLDETAIIFQMAERSCALKTLKLKILNQYMYLVSYFSFSCVDVGARFCWMLLVGVTAWIMGDFLNFWQFWQLGSGKTEGFSIFDQKIETLVIFR